MMLHLCQRMINIANGVTQMFEIIAKSGVGKRAGKALTFLLLLFYILLTAQVETLHKAFHDPGLIVSHSIEQERDPCHVAIYHNIDRGCDHDFHLTASDDCQICNFAIHGDQSPVTVDTDASPHSSEEFVCYDERSVGHSVVLSSSRAPPVV